MIIKRSLLNSVQESLDGEPAIIILYGPRQSGKTTLLHEVLTNRTNYLFLNGDDLRVSDLLQPDLAKLKQTVGDKKLLVIDEAQRIPNIGLSAKLLFDELKLPIIASGSASFDLANKMNEPLTGRATTYTLYPLSLLEVPLEAPDSIDNRLEDFLRFGMYPKTQTITGQVTKEQYLYDLINLYLYKDILSFESVRKPKKIIDLLQLLALQIGQEVSIAELAQNLALSKIIVEKYLDILEKMFIIINVRGFSRNLRKEISKTSKYYFVDLGLRNAIIRNFNPLTLRADTGGLFENFCIIERLKVHANQRRPINFYFWRTYDQKEIDYLEEYGGKIQAFEFKWTERKTNHQAAFTEFNATYPGSTTEVVNRANVEQFLRK